MGCISSKAIARSISIREELNNGLHSSRSAAWEELLNSHGGNDHLFALVCSTNSMTKLRSSSFTLPSTDDPPQTKYLPIAWDLIPEVTRKAEAGESAGPDYVRFTRSKSCRTIRENELLSGSDGVNENELGSNDRNQIGSRSFHTVEEYDALLERIHRLTSKDQGYYPWEKHEDPEEGSSSKNVVRMDEMRETGWKRKAVAKGLKSLDMPTIEFPAIGRFRQRVHAEGHVYSPGSYITPKFGSYNGKMAASVKEKEGTGESSLFSPDLVAAFEDCMQQLQEEEDSILRHMDDDGMEDQVEKVPSDVQIDVLSK